MNRKNVAELRRRMAPDKNNIGRICGCYVNSRKEIVSSFTVSLPLLTEDVAEKYLSVFHKTLSGSLGRNLIPVSFSEEQVRGGEEYALLSELRNSLLKDEEKLKAFFQRIIDVYSSEEGYVILLTEDVYDIAYKSKNGEALDDASDNMFRYLVCSICPVSLTKSALMYDAGEKNFHSSHPDIVMAAPQTGFLFPAFEGKGANIHEALFYVKDSAADYSELAEVLFQAGIPLPAKAQKLTFRSVLSEALEEECSPEVAEGVRERLCGIIAENKENKDEEPLTVTKRIVEKTLREKGVSEPKISSFGEMFDEQFGKGVDLPPENLINIKQYEVRTPDVQIRVNPEKSDLVEFREIDGVRCILIRAEDSVELNGVLIHTKNNE